MMHKGCHSIEELPYCFSRSSIKFPGHTVLKINDLNPILIRSTQLVPAIKSLKFALLDSMFHLFLTRICTKPLAEPSKISDAIWRDFDLSWWHVYIDDCRLLFSQSLLSLDLIEEYLDHWDKQLKAADDPDDTPQVGNSKNFIAFYIYVQCTLDISLLVVSKECYRDISGRRMSQNDIPRSNATWAIMRVLPP